MEPDYEMSEEDKLRQLRTIAVQQALNFYSERPSATATDFMAITTNIYSFLTGEKTNG